MKSGAEDQLPSSSPFTLMRRVFLAGLTFFLLLFVGPIAWRAALYYRNPALTWWSADRSSAGLLPPPTAHPDAAVRIFAARTVSWRGIFAVHSWIVLKDQGASAYQRWDLTAWGDPIRVDGFVADGRWFGQVPSLVYAADGFAAEALIPRMRAAIKDYRFGKRGDYSAWPGPNSNTFVAAVMAAVPEIGATLPPTAIGKDYPVNGRAVSLTPSRSGVRLSIRGYVGLTIGWIEGIEVNLFGGIIGLDFRRPALKVPAIGRIGF